MFWLVLAFLAIVVYGWLTLRPKHFPPGPLCLPFIGCAPFLPKKHIHFTMSRVWQKKYGPLVGLMLGRQPAVAVCSPPEVFEVLRREEFQGRHSDVLTKARSFEKKLGIFFSDGPHWVEQRRFTLRTLRDFGFGKRTMEGLILDEAEDLIKELKGGDIFEVTQLFNISSLNVLWGMMAGIRYSRHDEELKKVLTKVNLFLRSVSPTGNLVSSFAILKYIAPGISGYNEIMGHIKGIQDLMRETIRNHEKTLDESNPRDYIDLSLIEQRKQSQNPKSTFSEEGLIINCMDLFSAGAEAINSSLGFCLMYMVLYPKVQETVQKELDSLLGSRRPSLEDRSRLHYTEAVLTEVFRVNPAAPIAVPHRATRDTHLKDYVIPKDTNMLVCLYSLFEDQEHWGDPEAFRPERFLNEQGKYVNDEWMIPFGFGKRVCIGEHFTRSALFLFFVTLLQEFTFSVPEGDPMPSTLARPGVVVSPEPFRVKIVQRS